ncbi:hypothetical protein ACLK12_02540 [Escherichia coli]
MAFIKLKDWSKRPSPDRSANAIIGRAMGYLVQYQGGASVRLRPPPIPELGTATGLTSTCTTAASVTTS